MAIHGRPLAAAAIIAAIATAAACGGDDDGSGNGGADAGADSDSDADSDADTDSDSDAGYDFEAAAPWYECPEDGIPEEATIVTAFDRVYHYFGEEDARTIERVVAFPESSGWSQVGLRLVLECPESGLCDHWDRTGSVQLVLNPQDEEDREHVEIVRHITPYKIGMCQFVDVTPLAPLLTGERTLSSSVDTWVGPGHSEGEGWRVTVDFAFFPGEPGGADSVVNVWGKRTATLGDTSPDGGVDAQTDPVAVQIPASASRVEARVIATGHGFGAAMNCAEFCKMRQDVVVNGQVFSLYNWRDDCEENPVSPQYGTWEFDRQGWCPGAIVVGQRVDVTDALALGSENAVDFDVLLANSQEYDNYLPDSPTPYEVFSVQLYVYE